MMSRTADVLDRLERGEIEVDEAILELRPRRHIASRADRARRARWMRVQVREGDDGTNINIKLPLFLVGMCLGVAGLVIRAIPEERWNEWTGSGDRPEGENGSDPVSELMEGRVTKGAVLTLLGSVRQLAISGAGVNVDDGEDRVRVCLE